MKNFYDSVKKRQKSKKTSFRKTSVSFKKTSKDTKINNKHLKKMITNIKEMQIKTVMRRVLYLLMDEVGEDGEKVK